MLIENSFSVFGLDYYSYIFVLILGWIIIPFIGVKFLSNAQKISVSIFLITLLLSQDIIYDFFRIILGDYSISLDVPLHMCGLTIFISSYALWTKNQSAFELSYFWGLAGASQAIITPDLTRFEYGTISVLWNFLSHGIIILNVLWLVIVEKMRCRKDSLLNTLLITNGVVFITGYINKFLGEGANYWFISIKPSGDSPFLIGDWPYYLISFQLAGIILMCILYLPMMLLTEPNQKRGFLS